MQLKKASPTEVVVALLNRSACHVQVSAVLADGYGIYSWGWNGIGPTGLGQHAEAHCMSRANRNRVGRSTLYVASRRRRNGKTINSRPCLECQQLVAGCKRVIYRDENGNWVDL
jgi:deoxycytidylate deaminase